MLSCGSAVRPPATLPANRSRSTVATLCAKESQPCARTVRFKYVRRRPLASWPAVSRRSSTSAVNASTRTPRNITRPTTSSLCLSREIRRLSLKNRFSRQNLSPHGQRKGYSHEDTLPSCLKRLSSTMGPLTVGSTFCLCGPEPWAEFRGSHLDDF